MEFCRKLRSKEAASHPLCGRKAQVPTRTRGETFIINQRGEREGHQICDSHNLACVIINSFSSRPPLLSFPLLSFHCQNIMNQFQLKKSAAISQYQRNCKRLQVKGWKLI